MKQLMLILTAALTALAARAALPQPDLIAQIHFAGGDRISADKNFPAFTNEFTSPEALALRKQTADKLAPWLAGWLQGNLGTTVPGGAAKLRPLFDDLQAAEWFLEARAAAGARPDVAIAIKLDAAKAQLWQASLKPFFPAATFKQSGGWLIFDSGTGAMKLGDSLAQKISTPATGWATMDVNWPRLAQWFPALQKLELPETTFQVSADTTELLINGKFLSPQNFAVKLDPWQFPSNTVHQPFTSFTAVRGFGGWLKSQAWAQPYVLSPVQNQAFIWSLLGTPFQTFCAVPVADATSALQQLNLKWLPIIADRNAHEEFISDATLESKNDQLTLIGGPVIAPYVMKVKEPGSEFLLAGGFPNSPRSKPLPPELFNRLATPNLMLYHWEITAQRFPQQLQVGQYSLMLTRHKQLEDKSAPYNWVSKLAPTLGNTITEITLDAPDQMTFTRKAPGGLTAFEFLMLANWLDAPDFPHCNLQLEPISERLKQLRARHPQGNATKVITIPNPTPAH